MLYMIFFVCFIFWCFHLLFEKNNAAKVSLSSCWHITTYSRPLLCLFWTNANMPAHVNIPTVTYHSFTGMYGAPYKVNTKWYVPAHTPWFAVIVAEQHSSVVGIVFHVVQIICLICMYHLKKRFYNILLQFELFGTGVFHPSNCFSLISQGLTSTPQRKNTVYAFKITHSVFSFAMEYTEISRRSMLFHNKREYLLD